MQENKLEQANWSEPERVFPVATMPGLDKLPFSGLPALTNLASMGSIAAALPDCNNSLQGSCVSPMISSGDSCRVESSSGNMNPYLSLGLHRWISGNERTGKPQSKQHDGLPTSQCSGFDLNLLPDEMANEVAQTNTAEFALITPEKPTRGNEDRHTSETQKSGTDEKINQANKQGKDVVDTVFNLSKVNSNKELQEPITDPSLAAAASVSKENHNMEKRSSQGIEKIKTPKQKPKRKKLRPKVVTEGKPKGPANLMTPKSTASRGKKKYVRKKANKDIRSMLAEAVAEGSDSKTLRPAKRSLRRVLNFEYEEEPEIESFICSELEAQKNTEAGIINDLSYSMNQVQKEHTTSAEGEGPRTPLPTISNPLIGIGSTSHTLTEEGPAEGSMREYPAVDGQADTISRSVLVPQASQTMFWLPFPNIQKKRRTNNRHFAMSSRLASVRAANGIVGQETRDQNHTDPFATGAKYQIFMPSCTDRETDRMRDAERGLLSKLHSFERLTGLCKTENLKRKRSRSNTRARNLASLNKILSCDMPLRFSRKPQTIEAIISEIQSTLARKKRTKRNSLVNHSFSAKRLQLQRIIFFQHHHPLTAPSIGTSLDELRKQLFSIDAICEQFKLLDINRESPYFAYQEQNAIVPYRLRSQEQNALVSYKRDGTIVPFGGSFYPIKKQRPRPKVDLDDETSRVWKLLTANVNSEDIDGTDEEKEKWWEEERSVFHGRADSFIARMHLVQGDRRFSPWKGSVIDSVIGVFLTQNVSDHLSSSAFMSMAARFPLETNFNNKPCHEDGGSSVTQQTVKYLINSEDTMSAPTVCRQSSITIHDTYRNEETEVVDSDKTSRTYRNFSSSTNKSIYMLKNSAENAVGTDYEEKGSNTEAEAKEIPYFEGGGREIKVPSPDFILLSQDSNNSIASQNAYTTGFCSEKEDLSRHSRFNGLCDHSPAEIFQMSGATVLQSNGNNSVSLNPILTDGLIHTHTIEGDNVYMDNQVDQYSTQGISTISSNSPSSHLTPTQEVYEIESLESSEGRTKSDNINSQPSYKQEENISVQSQTETFVDPRTIVQTQDQGENNKTEPYTNLESCLREILDITESTNFLDYDVNNQHKTAELEMKEQCHTSNEKRNKTIAAPSKSKGQSTRKEKRDEFDWDGLRREVESNGRKRERTDRTMDSVDWEAVRCADVDEIAKTIRERGMNNMLAERIKDFLNRLDREHGSIDLEWLRHVPPDKAKEYLLSIRGLGLKSVECVRLLTLHHLAFPVDTNVGRIAVRLGWVPLQPLPESLQLHLLELYPMLESIQKYIWPRLCKLDQRTLYELHYQMITFGKVFCTKSKPNCNACPMKGECRHFASAFASARLALTGPEEKSIASANERMSTPGPAMVNTQHPMFLPQSQGEQLQGEQNAEAKLNSEPKCEVKNPIPIIEEPVTPEPECSQVIENDIEDTFYEDPDEIPTIKLNMEAFTQNLQNYMQGNMKLQEGVVSNALVALSAEAASIPMPKLKNMSRLRTEHQVYELPDSHPLLEGLDKREPDDPCSYLLAIWTPGETANSIQPPDKRCSFQGNGTLCLEETCFSCNSVREAKSQIVRGTLLIPCRTAMRGSFPLNGTYFQVNEVFADHDSSLKPIDVPRNWIWNLPRRTVYFGTSIPTIFRGLTTEGIQHCFWRGYVCVRGFDQKTRAPRPLMARLHFPASKLGKSKG